MLPSKNYSKPARLDERRRNARREAASTTATAKRHSEVEFQDIISQDETIQVNKPSAGRQTNSTTGRGQNLEASINGCVDELADSSASNQISPIVPSQTLNSDITCEEFNSGMGSRSESTRRLTSRAESAMTRNLLWAILASTVGSSFQHGFNGGVVNAPEKLISQFINDTFFARNQLRPDEVQVDFIFALMVSIFCVGGCIGALLTAVVADRLGRKKGLFYNNILVLLACPLMAGSRFMQSYEMLILGRLLIGVNAGLNAGLAPLYLNEISPINLRGALGTIYQLVITISILTSNLLGMPSLLGTWQNWPLLFAVPLLPAAMMLLALPKCSESPRYLLVNKGSELQAQQALAWFRCTGDIQDEMDELRAEREATKMLPIQVSLLELVQQRSLRRPLIISVVIMMSQQLSGINAVLFFSTSIFRDAGLSEQAAISATLGMSLLNVLMTLVSLLLVDRAGRKTLHMTGLLGMAFTCLVLALCLGGGSEAGAKVGQTSSFVAVVSVYLFVAMFASGPGSIPWFIVAELFPSNARPLASSIAVAVNWLANFTVSLCFLPLSNILHGYIFFLFAFLLVAFFLFTYYKVPETKNATAEEISALFKR